jgi:hypothetical protein
MQPATRTRRKDGRRSGRRSAEPCYYTPALRTVRQRADDLIAEAEAEAVTQAHIDQAWDLPFLVAGLPGVTIVSLGED